MGTLKSFDYAALALAIANHGTIQTTPNAMSILRELGSLEDIGRQLYEKTNLCGGKLEYSPSEKPHNIYEKSINPLRQPCVLELTPDKDISAMISTMPEACELVFHPGEYQINQTIRLRPHQSVRVLQFNSGSEINFDILFPEWLSALDHFYYSTDREQRPIKVRSATEHKLVGSNRKKAVFFPGERLSESKPLFILTRFNLLQDVVIVDNSTHAGVEVDTEYGLGHTTIDFDGVGFLYQETDNIKVSDYSLMDNLSSSATSALKHSGDFVIWHNLWQSHVIETPNGKDKEKTGKSNSGGQKESSEGKERKKKWYAFRRGKCGISGDDGQPPE